MYTHKRRNSFSNNRNSNSRNNGFPKRNHFVRPNQPRQLDAALFVNKAKIVAANETATTALFSEFDIHEKLKRNIESRGFSIPTPIQEKTIPYLLKGKDVIGIANTGTGKTAAFLIPLINKALLDRNQRSLIITPTRELAMQIADEFNQLARGTDLDAVLCIGGANIQRQEKKLAHNPHFIIGTTGRLIDLIKRKKLNIYQFQNVVLDEVDRMIDIGFLKDIQFLISYLPKKRQSLFFSATIIEKEKQLLRTFVTDPVTVSVKQQDTAESIDQDIIRVKNQSSKIDILHDLLVQKEFEKVLVFGRTKHGIEKLTRNLIQRGFRAAAIHSNKSQGQRSRALQEFKSNRIQILVATDVASRGLDIENVTHVINYDAPPTYEDYVHRIGRTGRAGKAGIALTFVD